MNLTTVFSWLNEVGKEVTLIGGQAVAVWEYILELPQVTETIDLDFLGDAAMAQVLAKRLHISLCVPSFDEETPNTAILVNDDGTILIDFLSQVAGLNETDIVRRRISLLTPNGVTFYILHPFDCLASRLFNFCSLPAKRNTKGEMQLLASIAVCQKYCEKLITEQSEHEAIKIVNRIFDLSLTDHGKRIYFEYGIDLIEAIPQINCFTISEFINQNLPRRIKHLQEKRLRYAEFLQRFAPQRLKYHSEIYSI